MTPHKISLIKTIQTITLWITLAVCCLPSVAQTFNTATDLAPQGTARRLQFQYNVNNEVWKNVPQPRDLDYPIKVPIGSTVEFRVSLPAGTDWPANKPVWSNWNNTISGIATSKTVVFNSASTTATDYKTVSVECGQTVNADVWVGWISRVQYRMDSSVPWVDIPIEGDTNYPLTIGQYDYVEFKAIKETSQQWPLNQPTWYGDGWVEGAVGDEVWAYFDEFSQDSTDLMTVSANCLNTTSGKILVLPRYSIYSVVQYSSLLASQGPHPLAEALVWAEVLDEFGFPLPGIMVNFEATYEDGSVAGHINGPGAVDDWGQTDVNGIAEVTLRSSPRLGDIFIRATVLDPSGQIIESFDGIRFESPFAEITFGPWQLDEGQNVQLCTIQLVFGEERIPVASRSVELDSIVSNLEGTIQEGAAILLNPQGITDNNGEFSSTLKWLLQASEGEDYKSDIEVYDLEISE